MGASLSLLSECFATGFSMDTEEVAKEGSQTAEWIAEMARKYNMAVGGGVSFEEDGAIYNRFFLADKSGKLHHYDKRHLFSFAREDKHYHAGQRRVIVEIDGVRVQLAVCYDIRFPVWLRNRGDYDVIACIANWPESRRSAWDTLLKARAIENVCYVCGVNIVGSDPNCNYSGGTAAVDFYGRVRDIVADNRCGIASIDIDIDALNEFKAKFPSIDDADNFEIIDGEKFKQILNSR